MEDIEQKGQEIRSLAEFKRVAIELVSQQVALLSETRSSYQTVLCEKRLDQN